MELMGFLGVVDDIRHHMKRLPLKRAYKPGPQAEILKTWSFLDKDEPTPAYPVVSQLRKFLIPSFPHILRDLTLFQQLTPGMVGQDEHEGIIRDHLKEMGCQVETDTELLSFEQDDEGVRARILSPRSEDGARSEESARFSYVVGADGARGTTTIHCLFHNFLTLLCCPFRHRQKNSETQFLGQDPGS